MRWYFHAFEVLCRATSNAVQCPRLLLLILVHPLAVLPAVLQGGFSL
jgi:hypothetical protein